MAKRFTQSQSNAQLVRLWRDSLLRESQGVPLLLIVGSKVLDAEGLFSNIAAAVERQEMATLKANGYSVEKP